MQKKENQRVRLTKRLIKEALLSMLDEQPLDTVNVSQLCRRAEVSRSTFYLHYGSEVDVLREIEDDVVAGARDAVQEASGAALTIGQQLTAICSYLREHRRVAVHVFSVNTAGSAFAEKLLQMRIDEQPERYAWLSRYSADEREIFSTFMRAGGYEVLRGWVLGTWDKTPEELGAFVDAAFETARQTGPRA